MLEGESIIRLSPAEIYKEIASIPQDRLKQGLVSEFSIQENLILGAHGNPPFCSRAIRAEHESHSRFCQGRHPTI